MGQKLVPKHFGGRLLKLMKLVFNFKLIDTYNRSLYEAGIGFGKYYSEYPDLILGLELSTQPHKTQLLLECQLW